MNAVDRRAPGFIEVVRELAEILDAPADRTYGVCVGGAMISEGDEYRSALSALMRAEELRRQLDAEGSDEPVQILLWREPLS